MAVVPGSHWMCGLSAACGSNNPKAQTPKAPPTPPPAIAPTPPAPPVPVDPITVLITTSQLHFDTGERELKVGHLDRARAEFDKALDVLLESPYGARTDSRMRAQFDRLVDRINAQEMTSLAQGDGFAEQKEEPASIDELLKIATFPKPAADAETAAVVKADLESTEHDVPIPQNSRIYAYVELFQGRLRDYIEESLDSRLEIPADDSERLQGRGPAARPRLHPDHRERLQDERRCPRPTPRARGSS